MEIIYNDLQIELTRRCNQACAHCCRGEAQDLDLTKDIIDALFEKNDIISIGRLLFSGGEPTLNGELLKYTVDKIIEKEINVDMFMFGINGLSYSQALVDGLNKLYDYIKTNNPKTKVPGCLMVSHDQFHEMYDEDVINKLVNLPYFVYPIPEIIEMRNILPYGRAVTNGLSFQIPKISNLTSYWKKYRLVNRDDKEYLFITYQYISSNGNVCNDGCQSYDLLDEYALGNVKEETIEYIYTKKNLM